jgi:hypothetical protein
MKSKPSKIIAKVLTRSPPAAMTIEKWAEWREQENARITAELQAQLHAWIELGELGDAGGWVH